MSFDSKYLFLLYKYIGVFNPATAVTGLAQLDVMGSPGQIKLFQILRHPASVIINITNYKSGFIMKIFPV